MQVNYLRKKTGFTPLESPMACQGHGQLDSLTKTGAKAPCKLLKLLTGFTLLEVMIVVVIVGVLAGIAIPNIAAQLPRYRLKAATRNLVSNMIKAKSQAIAENTSHIITFNNVVGQDTYTITVSSGTAFWGPIELSPGHPNIEYNAISFAANQLTFRSNGMAERGDITLKNSKNEKYTIRVFITGAIKVSK